MSSHYPPGKSLEIIPMGVTRLQIDQDIYVWCARIWLLYLWLLTYFTTGTSRLLLFGISWLGQNISNTPAKWRLRILHLKFAVSLTLSRTGTGDPRMSYPERSILPMAIPLASSMESGMTRCVKYSTHHICTFFGSRHPSLRMPPSAMDLRRSVLL